MGFWNVTAKDLREGDEIRVRVMGGEEFLTVQEIDHESISDRVRIKVAWGFHVPQEPFWDVLPLNERLTVRR